MREIETGVGLRQICSLNLRRLTICIELKAALYVQNNFFQLFDNKDKIKVHIKMCTSPSFVVWPAKKKNMLPTTFFSLLQEIFFSLCNKEKKIPRLSCPELPTAHYKSVVHATVPGTVYEEHLKYKCIAKTVRKEFLT